MRCIIQMILMCLLVLNYTFANGGAASLDEMILHQKEGIKKAREAKERKDLSKDLDKIFSEMIATQEEELKRLNKIRKSFYPEIEKSSEEFGKIGKDVRKEFEQMEYEMGKIFNKLRSQFDKMESTALNEPKIEIREDKKSYDIQAEVPGIEPENIKVKMVKNTLTIEGKREEETRRQGETKTSTEISYGEFKRTIPLDEKVDPSTLKIDYKNGIITVHIEKDLRRPRA